MGKWEQFHPFSFSTRKIWLSNTTISPKWRVKNHTLLADFITVSRSLLGHHISSAMVSKINHEPFWQKWKWQMSHKHVKPVGFTQVTTMLFHFFFSGSFSKAPPYSFEWPLILNKPDKGEPFVNSILTPSAPKPSAPKLRVSFYFIGFDCGLCRWPIIATPFLFNEYTCLFHSRKMKRE